VANNKDRERRHGDLSSLGQPFATSRVTISARSSSP
jgi:hypothetical protein